MEWVLLSLAIYLYRQLTSLAMIVLPIVIASLSYDNLILAIGSLIGEGELLENLSKVRFLLHYLVVPLFIVVGVELAHRAGAGWANNFVRVLSWFLAFGLAGIDINTHYLGMDLVAVNFVGMLRYKIADNGLPVITIVVNVFMMLIGVGLWFRIKWPWLLVGTLIALLGNGIPSSLVGTLAGSASEFVMIVSLLITEKRTQFLLAKQVGKEKFQPETLGVFEG